MLGQPVAAAGSQELLGEGASLGRLSEERLQVCVGHRLEGLEQTRQLGVRGLEREALKTHDGGLGFDRELPVEPEPEPLHVDQLEEQHGGHEAGLQGGQRD